MDHARAFGHARDMDSALLQADLLLSGLHDGIGSKYGARGILEMIGSEALDQFRQSVHDQMRVELDADDAGGRWKDLFGWHMQVFRDGIAACQRDTIAGARGTIRIAGVD